MELLHGINSLNDDVLLHVLFYVGKKSFLSFSLISKRSQAIYKLSGLPKQTFLFGYAPLCKIVHLYNSRSDFSSEITFERGIARAILYYDRKDLLLWVINLKNQDRYISDHICCEASKAGRLDIMRKVFTNSDKKVSNYIRENFSFYSELAAGKGNLTILSYLSENGIVWTHHTCVQAAGHGQLVVLKWLQRKGCPWNQYACEEATRYNHLDCLQFLYENGCKMNEEVCSRIATEKDHKDIIRWLSERSSS